MVQPTVYSQGDLYFCDPDPSQQQTTGSEMRGDHVWVIVSVPDCHRGNCVVGIPMSRHMNKAVGHLIKIPQQEITLNAGELVMDRVALTDQIRVLDKVRLRHKLGTVSQRAMTSIFDLGIDRLLGR